MERKIILHRGYKGKYPENSRISFEAALKENKSLETDIRVSKDGVCFMIHDDSLDRLFNGSGKIKEMTSENLSYFYYKEDKSQGLCSLKEMCDLMVENPGNSLIFIHIKESEDIGKVVEILERYSFPERIRFFAVDEIEEEFEKIMREKYPKYKIGLYLPENTSNYSKEKFKESDFIWADEITIPWITNEKVELAHSLGKPLYAISPELIPESIFNHNIKKKWKELLRANVDGICTDLPNEFLEFVNSN